MADGRWSLEKALDVGALALGEAFSGDPTQPVPGLGSRRRPGIHDQPAIAAKGEASIEEGVEGPQKMEEAFFFA